jgi:hypothetical protein
MHRQVEPEILDELPPADPGAVRSRADLRRLNSLMGNAGILSHACRHQLAEASGRSRPLRLVELGAGDGTLLLQLAQRWSVLGITAEVSLLDLQNIVSVETRHAFAAVNWSVHSVAGDVFTWLEQSGAIADVMLANLFLHHFPEQRLRTLLRLAAARTNLFIACEPRRSTRALTASRLLRFIGCNGITQHDAVVSVRAGFVGHELSLLWPAMAGWRLREERAGRFSHCFFAQRPG